MSRQQPVWRDASGAWGPAAFVLATVLAARRQPGYSHRRHHISGLAAQHTRSAVVMIPGFMALGAASLAMPSSQRAERALLRVAGVGTILAGLFRCATSAVRTRPRTRKRPAPTPPMRLRASSRSSPGRCCRSSTRFVDDRQHRVRSTPAMVSGPSLASSQRERRPDPMIRTRASRNGSSSDRCSSGTPRARSGPSRDRLKSARDNSEPRGPRTPDIRRSERR